MKIVFVIYAISWFILLTMRILSFFQNKDSNPLKNKEPWYLYALIIILSPIMVALVPYFIYSDFRDKYKAKKRKAEQDKKEAIEKLYIQQAVAVYNAAIKIPREKHSYAFGLIAKTVTEKIKKRNYDSIMTYLDKLSLPTGFLLHVEECKTEGTGGTSSLFVETSEGYYDSEIWKYIRAEDSIYGAWQSYFLYKIWHVLPLFWHAIYARRTYLYSKGDETFIVPMRKEDTTQIKSIVNSLIVNSDVVKGTNDKYYVSCCYWSDFEGLIQEIVEIFISPNNNVSFKDIAKNSLYKYKCGIKF